MRYPNFQLCSRVVFSTGKQTAAVWQEAAQRLGSREATLLCGAAKPGTAQVTFGAARVNTSPPAKASGVVS
jgi:hypothetical protein